jgi:starch synthase
MKVLFATAELAPLVSVGGLAYATAGLAKELHRTGVDVTVVIPDYGIYEADLGESEPLDMPPWVGVTTYRRGTTGDGVPLIAVTTPEIQRPHPYDDPDGRGWRDNDYRFMAFSAAIAELARRLAPDVLHLNDWHTAATLGLGNGLPPSVFTIHNLAYQGTAYASWLDVLVHRPEAYEWYGTMNPMSGAIALADAVVTVSPNYADEIRRPENGAGLHEVLAARGEALVGIRNGIDTEVWSPQHDPHLPAPFSADALEGKNQARRALLERIGWEGERSPLVAMVTRLTWQKGVDLALELIPYL